MAGNFIFGWNYIFLRITFVWFYRRTGGFFSYSGVWNIDCFFWNLYPAFVPVESQDKSWCNWIPVVFINKNTIKIWLSAKIQYLSAFSRKQTHQFTTYLLLTNEPWYASFPRYAKIWYNTSVLKQEKIE